MYNYNLKKEIIKNVIYITLILLLAIVSTYYIYNKFQVDRDVDFNSESLDVIYHNKNGDKLTIDKVTPVTDSVGLSSKSYNITIKNNLTEKVAYRVKIIEDLDTVLEDECQDNLITKEDIRISIKNGNKDNKIYNLVDLENGVLLEGNMKALQTKELSIRIWVSNYSTLPLGSDMHYHGIVQVIENDGSVAVNS